MIREYSRVDSEQDLRICSGICMEYVMRIVSRSRIQVYSMTYSGGSRDMHENMCGVCIGICREVSIPVTYSSIFRDIFRRVQGYALEYVWSMYWNMSRG